MINPLTIPEPAAPRPFNFPYFNRFTLSNGLEVLIAPYRELPLVSAIMCFKTFALIEPVSKEGLANLTADLLAEGTSRRNSTQIANDLESIGADYGVHIDWNSVCLELSVLSKYFYEAFNIFSDIILDPVFPQREFERLRSELLIDRLRSRDIPARLAGEQFAHSLYGNFRYGLPIEGIEASLQQIQPEDISEFYCKNFVPGNASLIITGGVAPSEALNIAQNCFEAWPAAATVQLPQIHYNLTEKTSVCLIHKEGAAQADVRVGHFGIDRKNPDFYSVIVLNEIFGGYFLSRINQNLREEHGYTYGISSVFSFRQGIGPFVISTAVHTEKCADALEEVLKEMRHIRKELVKQQEIDNAKGYLTGVYPLAFETAEQVALGLANMVAFNLPDDYYRTFREQISAVTREEVLEAAQKYLHPDHLIIVVVGDRAALEEQLRAHFTVNVQDVEL